MTHYHPEGPLTIFLLLEIIQAAGSSSHELARCESFVCFLHHVHTIGPFPHFQVMSTWILPLTLDFRDKSRTVITDTVCATWSCKGGAGV